MSSPQPPHALAVELDHPEADVPLVEHDDLVLVRAVVHHVAQGQEGGGAGEDGVAPGGITLKEPHAKARVRHTV